MLKFKKFVVLLLALWFYDFYSKDHKNVECFSIFGKFIFLKLLYYINVNLFLSIIWTLNSLYNGLYSQSLRCEWSPFIMDSLYI